MRKLPQIHHRDGGRRRGSYPSFDIRAPACDDEVGARAVGVGEGVIGFRRVPRVVAHRVKPREHRHGLVGIHLRSVLDVEAGGLREDHVPRAGPLGDALADALGAPGQHAVRVVDEEGLQVASAPVYVELPPRRRPERRRRGRGLRRGRRVGRRALGSLVVRRVRNVTASATAVRVCRPARACRDRRARRARHRHVARLLLPPMVLLLACLFLATFRRCSLFCGQTAKQIAK